MNHYRFYSVLSLAKLRLYQNFIIIIYLCRTIRFNIASPHYTQCFDWFCFCKLYLETCQLTCCIVTQNMFLVISGADRFAKDIELMTGRQVSKVLRIFWCVFMTGFLSVCIFTNLLFVIPKAFHFLNTFRGYFANNFES